MRTRSILSTCSGETVPTVEGGSSVVFVLVVVAGGVDDDDARRRGMHCARGRMQGSEDGLFEN